MTRAAGVSLAVAPIAGVPAAAEVNNQDPGKCVHSLATTGFAALQGEKASARGRFRSLLAQHFAVDAIGDRLIRRWRPKISDAQSKAYKAAFPSLIVGNHADRLYQYAHPDLKIVRAPDPGNNTEIDKQACREKGD